jgi:glycosyltransferase involved in cell wall biosynthesis
VRVVFITLSVVPFTSSDLLYYRAVESLLACNHEILISPWDWHERNAIEYDLIAQRGAVLQRRRRFDRSPYFTVRQLQKLGHKIKDYQRTWRFIEKFAPSVIVVNDPGTYHMCSVPGLARLLIAGNTPFVTISQYNDENTSLPREIYESARNLFTKARHCIFVSQRNLEVARRQLCLAIPQGRVLDNPPNLERWEHLAFPNGLPIRMAMVARLECTVKGQASVLQILAGRRWDDRNWELSLFGVGPDEAYLRDLIEFLGLDMRVRLRGYVDDVREIWREHQVLIMGSTGEGKPLALIEAMLCGRPAVVTDVGGNAELIEDGKTGFVAESPTVSSLSRTLDRAWLQQREWEEMGRRAHEVMARRLQPTPGQRLAALLTETTGKAQMTMPLSAN